MTCRRIVFTGDFLRPSYNGQDPTQHYNIQWCHDLLCRQFASATGLRTEMIAWNHRGVVAGQLDKQSIDQIYSMLGLPRSIQSWASVYEELYLPEVLDTFLAEVFRDALVVGFELPPYLEHVLVRHGIPFVDLIIHPVRFLDDIFFGIRTSCPQANEAVAGHAISEEFIHTVAGIQAAAARRQVHFAPPPGSALLLLQTRFDRTQIRDGGFIGAIDYLNDIGQLAAGCSTFYVKDHPLDPGTNHALAVRCAFRNVKMTTENVYRLMASEHIAQVLTLSSSTGIEARYFGKVGHFIYKEPNRFALDGALPQPGEFVGVFDGFLSPDFWREVLSSITTTTKTTGTTIPCKPNRLRTSLRSFWNFNEIDTDFAVGLAVAVAPKPGTTTAPKPGMRRNPVLSTTAQFDKSHKDARAAYHAGHFEGAMEHFNKAHALRPDDANLKRCMVETLLHLGRRDEAIALLRRARTLLPDNKALRKREIGVKYPLLDTIVRSKPFEVPH